MILTKAEIKWMLGMVADERDNSKNLMDRPGQCYAALHRLNYENMAVLAEKLEAILENDVKRITVR